MRFYIHRKVDACTSSKELYEVYRMWCEENSLNAIKARGFSDALIANQRRYNLESISNIVNSSGRRVRGFVAIEVLVQPDLSPNGWRAAIKPECDAGRRSLRLAGNDKISRKGHRTALRCCRYPFYFVKTQRSAESTITKKEALSIVSSYPRKETQSVPGRERPVSLVICGFFRVRPIQGRTLFLF